MNELNQPNEKKSKKIDRCEGFFHLKYSEQTNYKAD